MKNGYHSCRLSGHPFSELGKGDFTRGVLINFSDIGILLGFGLKTSINGDVLAELLDGDVTKLSFVQLIISGPESLLLGWGEISDAPGVATSGAFTRSSVSICIGNTWWETNLVRWEAICIF